MTTTDAIQVMRAVDQAHAWDSRWTAARDHYRDRRAERASYRAAERELSTYTTPADLQELGAMLERSVDENDTPYTHIIERILLRAA